MPLATEEFTEILGSFPAGVVVVTTIGPEGEPAGLTTTAFCSVSIDPLLVLVCVGRSSRTLAPLRHRRSFGVNFLRSDRREVADRFASKAGDKFAGIQWTASPAGIPWLVDDSLALLECGVTEEIDAGDHVILVGRAQEGALTDVEARPLMYFRGSYGSWPG